MSVYSNNDMKNIRANDSWFKIETFVPEGARVLDVGCSSGNLGKALKKSKKIYCVGIDIDIEDTNLAKKVLDEAHVINLENDDLNFLGTFDVIIMADVIEHLVDPVMVLQKLKPLLKKKGKFIFSIPNMANVTTRLELLKGRFEYKDFGLLDRTHIHFYDHAEVERIFAAAGYVVKETDCTIRTIPDDILKKELKNIGIELTDTLKKHLNNPDARTFQFIGYAQVHSGSNGVKLKSTTPLDVITQEIDAIRDDFSGQISEKNEQLETIKLQYNNASSRLSEIYQSKGWKMLELLYNLKSLFSKKSRKD